MKNDLNQKSNAIDNLGSRKQERRGKSMTIDKVKGNSANILAGTCRATLLNNSVCNSSCCGNNSQQENLTFVDATVAAQRKRFITHLALIGSLNTFEARERLSIPSPAGRVLELKRKGFVFDTTRGAATSASGSKHKQVARYSLKGFNPEQMNLERFLGLSGLDSPLDEQFKALQAGLVDALLHLGLNQTMLNAEYMASNGCGFVESTHTLDALNIVINWDGLGRPQLYPYAAMLTVNGRTERVYRNSFPDFIEQVKRVVDQFRGKDSEGSFFSNENYGAYFKLGNDSGHIEYSKRGDV
jgi:hypothetical protein